MSSLPTAIISEILSREPVEDLLRFRCVSKSWCSLIDDPFFIKLHLNRSNELHSNETLILKDKKLFSLNPSSQKLVVLDHPLKYANTALLGSCNGLLCISSNDDVVAIWNPSTKKHHILPLLPIRLKDYEFINFGFGYDRVHDDYKVLVIAQFRNGCDDGVFKSEVGVYSLKSDLWNMNAKFPYESCFKDCGVFVSGALHYMVMTNSMPQVACCVAFDLDVEKTRLVPLPEHVESHTYVLNVGMLRGCLYLLCNWITTDIDIWVMNDYGVKSSWTKLICISPQVLETACGYLKPLAYSNNGDSVFMWQELYGTDHIKLHWYDLKKKTLKNVEIPGVPLSFEAMPFVGSIVPVNGGSVIRSKKQLKKKSKTNEKRDDFLSKGFKLKL